MTGRDLATAIIVSIAMAIMFVLAVLEPVMEPKRLSNYPLEDTR